MDSEEIKEAEVISPTMAVATRPTPEYTLPPGELSLVPSEPSPYGGAGTLDLTETQIKILMEELPLKAHDIKPTGEVFVPQVEYRRVLNTAFGPGQWAMVPMSDPKQEKNANARGPILITQKWHLVVKGHFVSEVWGEMDYQPTNPNMSEATAIEGAKSNALMRCCKDLGIGSECWDKAFTQRFKEEECVQVMAPNYSGEFKAVWRRKDRTPFKNERPVVR